MRYETPLLPLRVSGFQLTKFMIKIDQNTLIPTRYHRLYQIVLVTYVTYFLICRPGNKH
jgi:hypothetical protein